MLQIKDLTTEYVRNPIGVDASAPRLSWKLISDRKNVMQASYRILAYGDADCTAPVWDSGTVMSSQSLCVRWSGRALNSRERVFWKVIVSDGTDKAQSGTAFFEMGLLHNSDWKARWIEPEGEVNPDSLPPAPLLRREFTVRSVLKRARIYQSAHGLYEFWLNGEEGTEDKFKPGFTNYYDRIQYQVYDVTALLAEGVNCWAVQLGDGWWRGTTGGTYRNNFGYKLAYIGQILLEYEDGSFEYVTTDENFRASTGGLLASDMKLGDAYDARIELSGWKRVGFDDSAWTAVHYEEDEFAVTGNLIPSRSLPVREMETFTPEIMTTPNGETVLNFGQNIAGYVKMRLHGAAAGQEITLIHGEMLDHEGNFTMQNLTIGGSSADIQTVRYTARGAGEESYWPLFSVFGFQYVLVKGYEVTDPAEFTAVAVYSALEETGDFTCSNPLINQLVSNSRWSQKGNFLDVPTDCPTRERSPWTGDSQIYVRTASDFMNVYPFFEKWMLDLNSEQFPSGKIPNTFPQTNGLHSIAEYERMMANIAMMPDTPEKMVISMTLGHPDTGNSIDGSSGWGDTAVITPYLLYQCYGDRQILINQYDSAKKWVDYMAAEAAKPSPVYADQPYYRNPEDAVYVWDTGFHWGEWLEAGGSGEMEDPQKLFMYPDYRSATSYYFYSSHLLAEIAKILGRKEDAEHYEALSRKVKAVFNKYFIAKDGTITEGKQALNVRALMFNLADEDHRDAVAGKLNQMIADNGYHLNTGFLSTTYLLPVLADCGYVDTAYKVLEQTGYPGWLYNVICGATTILESWNGFELCMNSFNHYSYGAVCDFLFSRTAGIRPEMDAPGYRHFTIRPVIGGSLTSAAATYESGYGTIESAWEILKRDAEAAEESCGTESSSQAGELAVRYTFRIPANTKARVIVPYTGELMVRVAAQFPNAVRDGDTISFEVGSGRYVI